MRDNARLLGVVVMLLRERRRHINALECANDDLEQRVRVRTAALEGTNDRRVVLA